MLPSLRIPGYAKAAVRKALRKRKALPESRKFALDAEEAGDLGINSGVEQGKYLLNHNYLSYERAGAYGRFYQRFQNCRTPNCEDSLRIWGGRKFLRNDVLPFLKKHGNSR